MPRPEWTLEEKADAAEVHGKKGGKQIMGVRRRQIRGQAAVNKFLLEDGTEVMEKDNGDAAAKWPVHPKKDK